LTVIIATTIYNVNKDVKIINWIYLVETFFDGSILGIIQQWMKAVWDASEISIIRRPAHTKDTSVCGCGGARRVTFVLRSS